MSLQVLELGFKITGYSLFLYGIWLLISPLITSILRAQLPAWKRRRINRKQREQQGQASTESSFMKHIKLLVHATRRTTSPSAVSNFIFLSLSLGSVSSIFLIMVMEDIVIGLTLGLLIASLPYIFLRIRLSGLRSKNSVAFLRQFHIILSNYQSTGKDIYFTIVNTVGQVKDPHIKQSFILLLHAMQLQKNPEDFTHAVQIFMYSINSHFAKRFGKQVIKAHLARVDIFKSLMQLDEDIRRRKIDIEEEATKNQDTVWQGYFPLFSLPLAVFFSYQMAGVLNYWFFFTKKLNLTLFIVCVMLSIISVLLASALRKPKADI